MNLMGFFVLQTHFHFDSSKTNKQKKQTTPVREHVCRCVISPPGGVKGHGQSAQISQVSAVRSVAPESAGLTFTNR